MKLNIYFGFISPLFILLTRETFLIKVTTDDT